MRLVIKVFLLRKKNRMAQKLQIRIVGSRENSVVTP